MSHHNPLAPIGLIISAFLMLIAFSATKLIYKTPDFLEIIKVDSGDTFYITLTKPTIEDYAWSIEYDENYAKLINQKSGAIGGFKSRDVYSFKGLEHGIIYIICNYGNPKSIDIKTRKIFEVRIN